MDEDAPDNGGMELQPPAGSPNGESRASEADVEDDVERRNDAGEEKPSLLRTPAPTDRDHTAVLLRRSLRNDLREPKMWFARTLAVCLLFMLYTIGFSLNYRGDRSDATASEGGYALHPGEPWNDDISILLSGSASARDVLPAAAENLGASVLRVEVADEPNATAFKSLCESRFGGAGAAAADWVGVFVDSDTSYGILGNFGGAVGSAPPFASRLAGAQRAVDVALLNASGAPSYAVDFVQHTPEKLSEEGERAPYSGPMLLPIGALLAVSAMIMTMFLLAPMLRDRFEDVVRSFVLVGVKLRIYLLQVVLYLSLMGLLTAGGLTGVSIGWRLYPLSNAGLVFLSHYLGLVQLYAVFVFLSQLPNNLELAQNVPWLVGFVSIGLAAPFVVLDVPTWPLHLLTAISPFTGMVNYCAIYVGHDAYTGGAGVHPGVNAASSGLLACTMAQVAGIILWLSVLIIYSSPNVRRRFSFGRRPIAPSETTSCRLQGENFEPLAPGAELLVSLRGVFRSFTTGCRKKTPPVEVLRGLDMDICRGEVFGFLGHNGAGKTTTIRCATGEIDIDAGSVTYHLEEGMKSVEDDDVNFIRRKIGVCPQNNMIIRNSTCRETLSLFASLKGRIRQLPGQSGAEAIAVEVDRWLSKLDFDDGGDADKPVQTFSGGMKRKMSIAVSLLGDPDVVFLDEPTAGCDPYSRRQVWDMILAAKAGRSIILTTHFMDEADVLSDRVGIIKDGKLMTCGSSLFLKHNFGIGYSLHYSLQTPESVCLPDFVPSATEVPTDVPGTYRWDLPYGTEPTFFHVLTALGDSGATDVTLELTTLEQVFLETAKDNQEMDERFEDEEKSNNVNTSSSEGNCDGVHIDVAEGTDKDELLGRIWEPRAAKRKLSSWQKFNLVQRFCLGNALKMKGAITLNIVMPLIYMVACMIVVRVVGVSKDVDRVVPEDIPIGTALLGQQSGNFFGVPQLPNRTTMPLVPTDEPSTLEDYFSNVSFPFAGGYFAENRTLQYNATFNPFALQIGEQLLASYSVWLKAGDNASDPPGGSAAGMTTRLVPLPYDPPNFRIDLLLIPVALSYGFLGMVFTVLDVLLLKSNKIFGLFRVVGISEWSAHLGIVFYKLNTTFVPFFVLVVALGLGLQSVIWGDGGRWLATVLILFGYAISVTPIGLLIANLFLSDFESVKNWFPGVYMTFMVMPFVAWAMLLQFLPNARDIVLIIGDVLCILPPFAFQRGLGQVVELSTEFNDPELTWASTWSWESRVYYTILMMIAVGSLEWWYLHRLTCMRPPKTKLRTEEMAKANPLDVSNDADVTEERERSLCDDEGINARDLVKVFSVKTEDENKKKKKSLKVAVQGVSFGIRKNEIYALLGPNGAGKTTAQSVLSGDLTPEHGEVALVGHRASIMDTEIGHLFGNSNISYCPQFDSLFPTKTVLEHLKFYAKIRGCDWEDSSAQQHVDAIVQLLGLEEHVDKSSQDLSGGYKRRLSLAVALIGYPDAMLLDEPTTGMSPDARRRVWEVLRPSGSVLSHGLDLPATLLSTHYMDEASELGSRIGIMIDGALVVSGTLGRLREKYCNSYFVEIALRHEAPGAAQDTALATFAAAGMEPRVFESLPYRFKLQVPFLDQAADHCERTRQLARIFALLEGNREALYIKFYSVQQMSLEQIFIDLCRKQFEAEETERV